MQTPECAGAWSLRGCVTAEIEGTADPRPLCGSSVADMAGIIQQVKMMLLLRLAEGDAMLDGIVLGGVGFSVVAWAGAVMLQWSPMLLRRGEWRAAEDLGQQRALGCQCSWRPTLANRPEVRHLNQHSQYGNCWTF